MKSNFFFSIFLLCIIFTIACPWYWIGKDMHTNEKECNLATPPLPKKNGFCMSEISKFFKNIQIYFSNRLHLTVLYKCTECIGKACSNKKLVQLSNWQCSTCLEPRLNKQSLPDSDTQWVCNLLLWTGELPCVHRGQCNTRTQIQTWPDQTYRISQKRVSQQKLQTDFFLYN